MHIVPLFLLNYFVMEQIVKKKMSGTFIEHFCLKFENKVI